LPDNPYLGETNLSLIKIYRHITYRRSTDTFDEFDKLHTKLIVCICNVKIKICYLVF